MLLVGLVLLLALSFSSAEQCRSVDCSSRNYKFASCGVPGAKAFTRVELTIKYSKSPCIYGRSFGPGTESIWVNKGCRGRFNVCYETDVTCTTIDCSSIHYKFKLCPVPKASRVTSVRVQRKYSKSSCRFGHGYGSDRGSVWVNHGCRAKFAVCYV